MRWKASLHLWVAHAPIYNISFFFSRFFELILSFNSNRWKIARNFGSSRLHYDKPWPNTFTSWTNGIRTFLNLASTMIYHWIAQRFMWHAITAITSFIELAWSAIITPLKRHSKGLFASLTRAERKNVNWPTSISLQNVARLWNRQWCRHAVSPAVWPKFNRPHQT